MDVRICLILYREISDLHKARVTHVSEAQKAALDVEVAAKEQLREALDECKLQAKREKMMQLNQVCIVFCQSCWDYNNLLLTSCSPGLCILDIYFITFVINENK